MQKNDVVKIVADELGISFVQCERTIDLFIEEMKKCLVDGKKLTLKNFATFEVKERKERLGRNPSTNDVELFPATKSPKCKFSKALKDSLNGKRETKEDET